MTESKDGTPLRVRMHDGEIDTDAALVRRLLAAQFPRWAHLPVTPVASSGTDNAMYRLGADLAVRLPRIPWAVLPLEKEILWLPRLAPHLPVAISLPLAAGVPGEGYPWRWSICRWLSGANPVPGRIADEPRLALDLAAFLRALRGIDARLGPAPGRHNFARGEALARRDAAVRKAALAWQDQFDVAAVTAIWNEALKAPAWSAAPVWLHGDLSAGNLLVGDDGLAGVIDFGCLGVGDPAGDLIVAWSLFSAEGRAAFRAALAVDMASWARGRGWALATALNTLPYYRDTNPAIVAGAARTLGAILADHTANGRPALG
ncbi:MAG TPA: aminoglycoside phosphotransferase family protein [Rhizomicrobium sp.]|jgi:aminoglycoside phosphotransferase (APT) family kinase protein|nr:aminoglycoside phosphotransferase family protein [Rhizomicrobium sp.]